MTICNQLAKTLTESINRFLIKLKKARRVVSRLICSHDWEKWSTLNQTAQEMTGADAERSCRKCYKIEFRDNSIKIVNTN